MGKYFSFFFQINKWRYNMRWIMTNGKTMNDLKRKVIGIVDRSKKNSRVNKRQDLNRQWIQFPWRRSVGTRFQENLGNLFSRTAAWSTTWKQRGGNRGIYDGSRWNIPRKRYRKWWTRSGTYEYRWRVNWLDFRHCSYIPQFSGFPSFGNAFDFPEGYAFFVSGHGWT